MKYDLFLFDLDDTLLDFKASERKSFFSMLESFSIQKTHHHSLFTHYQTENRKLWQQFEQAQVTKEHLKVERFRRIFTEAEIEIDPEAASHRYLESLPESVVLVEHATEICAELSRHGEIGIVTNGISSVQSRRIQNSAIAPYISFVSVSEDCGYAKPDVRFFEYSSKLAKKFRKHSAIVIGDRLETDVLGAHNYGLDSCWYNPDGHDITGEVAPKYHIRHLSELSAKLQL